MTDVSAARRSSPFKTASTRLPALDQAADSHPDIRRAVGFIHAHFSDSEAVSAARVAEQVGLSEPDFNRHFRRVTGVAFNEYVAILRVRRAVRLIAERPFGSIIRVAQESGFDTVRTFRTQFTRLVGMQPSEYRTEMRRWASAERAAGRNPEDIIGPG